MFQGATSGPDALTRSRVDRLDLLLFALAMLLVVPTLIWLIERLIERSSRTGAERTHAGVIGVLLGLVVWQALDQSGVTYLLSIPVLMVASVAFSLLYLRTPFMRTMAGLLALATPVVFVALWLSGPGLSVLKGTDQVEAGEANGVPVVVMVLDEFPLASIESGPGRIDRRFPNIAGLAKDGTWYRNALSVADVTTVALPAILAGERGGIDTPPSTSQYPQNLFSLLGSAGYSITADEQVTDLCPHELCTDRGSRGNRFSRLLLNGTENGTPAPSDLATKIAEPVRSSANELTPRPATVASSFLENLDASPESLAFVHLMLPHVPWTSLPDGRTYEAPLAPGLDLYGESETSPWDVPQKEIDSAFQRQQIQLGFLDRQIGRMVRQMKEKGVWDDALVIVVADHGASFQRGILRRHLDSENAGWILPVPMFVKYPGQKRGRIDPRPADLLDILPTILEETGVEAPGSLEGSSLRAAPADEAEIIAESSDEGSLTLSRSDVGQARRQAVRRRMKTFTGGSPWVMAGHPGLLGRPVERIPGLTPVEAEFESPWPETEIEPGARQVPAYVTGTVESPIDRNASLIVVLNGRVAGTVGTWADGDLREFAFTLPPELLQPGLSRVELFEPGS